MAEARRLSLVPTLSDNVEPSPTDCRPALPADLIATHLARLELAGFRPRTIYARKAVLTAFQETLSKDDLLSGTRDNVEAYLSRPLAAETKRAYLGHLRSFYAWCVEEGFLDADPTRRVPAIRVPRGTPRPIDSSELTRAVDAAPPRMRVWLLLMSLAGLRCLEVAGLRPQDLLEHGPATLLRLRECKGGGSATVPAHPAILEALAVLPMRDGAWWTCGPHAVSIQTSTYLRSLGVNATAHQLRHWAGTSWYRASGHDLLATAQLMRHASVTSTQIYAQLDPTRGAEVVASVRAATQRS